MFRSRQISMCLVLALVVSSPLLAQKGGLRGIVEDADGEPLAGVKVTATSESLPHYREIVTTDERGKFLLRFQASQSQYRFELLFEKIGYESFIQPYQPSSIRATRETYVMNRGEAQAVASHGDLSSVLTGTTNEAITAFNAGLKAQIDGDLREARSKLEEATASDPELGPAWVALSQVRLDLKDHAGAVEAADRAVELRSSTADALRVKLQALRALDRKDEADAVAALLESAEDAEASARRIYNEGGEAFQAGDKATALEKFRKAAELDPSLREAHHAMATLELANGNAETAAEAAETALSLGSDDLATLRVLYDAYDALGRTEELMSIAPRLAAVDPDFGGAKLLEQAAQLWNAGQAEKAVALSRQALAIDSTQVKAWYFIGLQHLSSGENAEARAALEKFIAAAPDDPDAAGAKEMLAYIE